MQDSEKWKEVTQSFPTWPLKDPLSPTSHLSPPGALPSMLVHALISLTLKHKHGSKQNLNNKNKLQLVLWSVPLLQVHFSVTLKNFSKEFPALFIFYSLSPHTSCPLEPPPHRFSSNTVKGQLLLRCQLPCIPKTKGKYQPLFTWSISSIWSCSSHSFSRNAFFTFFPGHHHFLV